MDEALAPEGTACQLAPEGAACELSPFSMLPVELHHKIFSYLNHVELATVSLVCRKWLRLVMAPLLWRNLTISKTCDVQGVCIFKSTPFLRSLTLNLDSVLEVIHVTLHLAMCCPKLTSLKMSFCCGVNPRCIRLLATFCPCLEELNLEGCEEVDDDVIDAVLGLSKLKKLNLSHCRRVTDKAILAIADSCENLESLYINGNTFITDESVMVLASARKTSLQALYLDGESLTDASYLVLSQCEKLTTLQIWYVEKMTDEGLLALMSLKELRNLEIRQAKDLSSQGLTMLFEGGNLSKLVSLNLTGCHQLQDAAVKVFSQSCHHLQQLVLAWCWEVTDEGLESIVNYCWHLTRLDLTGLLLLKGDCLSQIPESLPRLEYLDVQQCGQVTDQTLEQLYRRVPRLIILNYYGEVISCDTCAEAASNPETNENLFVLSDAMEKEPR